MARGKAAAQAANRRLTEATERIAALEQQLNEVKVAHRAEMAAVKQALASAQNKLVSDVDDRAREAIRDAEAAAAAAVAEAQHRHIEQVIAGFDLLDDLIPDGVRLPGLEGYAQVAAAFGVQVADLMAKADGNRRTRRTTNRRAHDMASWRREVARTGRPLLADPEAAKSIQQEQRERRTAE